MRFATRTTNPGSKNEIQQCNYNTSDAAEQFRLSVITTLGEGVDVELQFIIADRKIHRFKINGKLDGWYIFHADGRAAGRFGDWRQDIKQNWKASGNFIPLSEFQRQAFKAKCQQEAAQRQRKETAKHEAAAKKAAYIWNHATYATTQHPYLIRKRIDPHGAKLGRGNTLIIPQYNAAGELVNLQFISEDGGKRFLSGGQKKGCFLTLGEVTEKILIAEGFATGASLFEDSGHHTVIAFDKGNLEPVAKVIRQLHPNAQIIICGDNDLSGVGQKAAREAALACGGKYILPPIEGMDWNDYLTMERV
ncbi:MAG: toprim domain-containing protein [Methylococcales bacterium]|nr:toprim domain-containing protein [Methylococcales bacterium]